MSKTTESPQLSRRSFVKAAGAAGVGAMGLGLVGCSPKATEEDSAPAAECGPMDSMPAEDEGEWIPTSCNMCFNNCGILVHVVDGVAVDIKGNPASSIGNGRICAKGAAGISWQYNPDRITKPLKRTNPEKGFDQDPMWEEITWDEAYGLVMQGLGTAAANNPMTVGGASMVQDLNASVLRGVAVGCAFGGSQGMLSDICGAGIHVIEAMYTGCGNARPDYDNTNYIMQFGTQAGTATRHGFNHTAEPFAKRRAEGLRLISFDPHMSAGAEKADKWVALRPGSDAAVSLAMQNVLVHELGIYDAEFLVERTNAPALVDVETQRILRNADRKAMYWDNSTGAPAAYNEVVDPALEGTFEVDGKTYRTAWDLFKDHIKDMTPEWAEEISTVPAATLRQLAKEFGEAACIGETIQIDGKTFRYRPAAVDLFSGVSRNKHAILSTWSVLNLNVIVGSVNAVGGFIGYGPQCFGWTDTNPNAAIICGLQEDDGFLRGNGLMIGAPHNFYDDIRDWDYTPSSMALAELQPLSEDGHFVHIAQADPDRYHTTPIDALLWYGCNPIKWWANRDQQAEIFKKMSFIVGIDCYLNDMSLFSDVMLPECTYLERDNILPQWFLNHRMIGGMDRPWTVGVWQKVVEPKDGAPSYFEIFTNLVDMAGTNMYFNPTLNALYRVKEEYQLPVDQKMEMTAFTDAVLKSNIDEEHGWEWLKEHGVYDKPRNVSEVYIWDDQTEGRLPLYWDFMLTAKEKVDAKVAELGIPWESDDYIPLPEWRPGKDFWPKDDPAFDLFPVYYTNAQNTDSWTVENPWIDEINENDGVTYMLEINEATAKAKGLESGDTVKLTSTDGFSLECRIVCTQTVHPEVVSCVVGTWDAQSERLTVAKGKGVNIVNLIDGQDPERYDHVVSAFDAVFRVKIEKM
ncbi:MAG: molybdopterin-dependent oxidoreductase [Eggerthellales bacterium]|nr:molybdopterin-dependent oxidoreductase [Eggerthellales bacterium]